MLKKIGIIVLIAAIILGSMFLRKFFLSTKKCLVATEISSGYYHNLALKEDGTVYGWGCNSEGQLGVGNTIESRLAQKIKGLSNIIQISCGAGHSLALNKNGEVWAWGNNDYGEVGCSEKIKAVTKPHKIEGLESITEVQGGDSYTVALDQNGDVWCLGDNANGSLATDSLKWSRVPQKIHGLPKIKKISAGGNHVLALDYNGNVWGWGSNEYNQLGELRSKSIIPPIKINLSKKIKLISAGNNMSIFVDENLKGQYMGTLNDVKSSTPKEFDKDIENILSYDRNIVYIKKDSSVWTIAYNEKMECIYLGDFPYKIEEPKKIKNICTGYRHFTAIDSQNKVWAWGWNQYYAAGGYEQEFLIKDPKSVYEK